MDTLVHVMIVPMLLGFLELSVLQFVGFPTLVLDVVYFVHYQKEKKWVLPAYCSLAFLIEGINLLLIQDVMFPLGCIFLLMSLLIPFSEWLDKKLCW
jgi:hypothetical protein